MVRTVVMYGDPVLRQKGSAIESITPEIRQLVADMVETMQTYHGVGLAAQQVGEARQLTVIDVREVVDRPSWAERDGARIDLDEIMPLVLINPQVTPVGSVEDGPEGCLSFPEMYGEIPRPGVVEVEALDADGQTIALRCGGLLARAIQHEVDHLHGILFIDRMRSADKTRLQPELDALRAQTQAWLEGG